MTFSRTSLLIILLLACCQYANASLIRYDLSGQIIFIFDVDDVVSSVTTSDEWTATIFIDDLTPDADSNPLVGRYEGITGNITIGDEVSIQLSDSLFTSSNDIRVVDGARDSLIFSSYDESGSAEQIDFNPVESILIELISGSDTSFSDTLFSGTDLSQSVGLDISEFILPTIEVDLIDITGTSGLSISFLGQVAEYSATVVPIPAAVWFLGSGLLGLVAWSQRKNIVS